jgi:hypothetical protein
LLLTDCCMHLSCNCCYQNFNTTSYFPFIVHMDMLDAILILNTVILRPWTEVPWMIRALYFRLCPS